MKKERTKGKNLGGYIAEGAKGLGALTILGCIAGTAAIIGYWGHRTFTDAPETYENFGRYEGQGYEPVSSQMDTKGDVIWVKLLADEKYKEKQNDNGQLVLSGKFEYAIEPNQRFAPKDNLHTDQKGRSPFPKTEGIYDPDYWEDTRDGTITLEKKATKE